MNISKHDVDVFEYRVYHMVNSSHYSNYCSDDDNDDVKISDDVTF
jgi:hypothetical protein